MEGFVTKRGHLITNWKVRWFQLENGEIRYYTDKTRQVLKGRYILRKETIISPHADMGLNKNVLLLFTSSHPFRKRALYFSCDSAESMTAWQHSITRQIEALKSGNLTPAPAPTIIESTIQQLDNVTSLINDTITGAVSKVRTTVETVVGESSTNDADVEELLRGRPAPRLNRIERSDPSGPPESTDAAAAGAASRTARKRLSAHPAAVSGVGPEWEKTNLYTAADYDSSDTDGSVDERFGSHSARTASRTNSVGNHADQKGSAAALSAEALNSALFQKRVSGPRGKGPAAIDDSELPRVSVIVAEEAAAGGHVKNGGVQRSPKPEAPVGSGGKGGGKTQDAVTSSSGKGDSSATPRKKSFTAEDKSWIKPSTEGGSSKGGVTGSSKGADADTTCAVASPSKAAGTTTSERVSEKSGGRVDLNGAGVEGTVKGAHTRTSAGRGAGTEVEAEAEADNPWVEAYTAEGEKYYYHKVTRLARWDKPKAHVQEAVESRMRDLDLATERSLRERREEMERAKQREREAELIKAESMGEIERTVQRWSMDKQRAGRELSFPELLRDLVFVLPSDLLLLLYESNHRSILDALQEFTVNSPSPPEVKKAYLRVVRFVHPDKLPQEIETASKLLVERVFIHLTQKYDLYRKAHELG